MSCASACAPVLSVPLLVSLTGFYMPRDTRAHTHCLCVQLRYGEDGMDPVVMEGKGGEPVMFSRVLSVVKASQPKHLPGPAGAERQRQQQPGAGAGPAAMEVDGGVVESPTAGGKRRRGAKRPPASPAAARPLSPGSPMGSPLSPRSPTAAAAAAAVLAAAADGSGGRPLVPLPEQLQQAVDAAMSSGGRPAPACTCFRATVLCCLPAVSCLSSCHAWAATRAGDLSSPRCDFLPPPAAPAVPPADQLRGDNDFCSEKYRDSVRGFLEQQVGALGTARCMHALHQREARQAGGLVLQKRAAPFARKRASRRVDPQAPTVATTRLPLPRHQVSAVRTARKRLGLPAGQRGAYELERLVNPGGRVLEQLPTFACGSAVAAHSGDDMTASELAAGARALPAHTPQQRRGCLFTSCSRRDGSGARDVC